MKRIFFMNALILTGTSLLLRTVNISFRVYISNKIGAEGMGLYQLIMSVYSLAATLATSGISIAVTRLAAEALGRGSGVTANMVLKKSFTFCLLFSTAASVLLFAWADYVSLAWLQDGRTAFALKILASSLPFIGVSSCLRGYFYAVRKVIKPASAQILEQFTRIFIVINVISIFAPKGLESACSAVVFGTTAAEMVSCTYMFILYRWERRKASGYGTGGNKQKGVLKQILYISLPVAASSYVRSGLRTVENFLIPLGFKKYGASNQASLAEYGMIRGMVMPILTFPSAFLSAFSTLLLPEISEANARNHKKRVNYVISRVFQTTLLLSILVAGVFITFSDELGIAIYKSKEAGTMLKTLAPLIPFMYLDRIVDGMMKALNQQISSLKYDILDSLTRIGMVYFLIPVQGIAGFIVIMFVSNALNSFLSINRLLKVTKLQVSFMNWIIVPAFSAAASGFIVHFAFKVTGRVHLSLGIGVTVGIILITVFYLTFLFVSGSITKDDINWFKSCFKNTGCTQAS